MPPTHPIVGPAKARAPTPNWPLPSIGAAPSARSETKRDAPASILIHAPRELRSTSDLSPPWDAAPEAHAAASRGDSRAIGCRARIRILRSFCAAIAPDTCRALAPVSDYNLHDACKRRRHADQSHCIFLRHRDRDPGGGRSGVHRSRAARRRNTPGIDRRRVGRGCERSGRRRWCRHERNAGGGGGAVTTGTGTGGGGGSAIGCPPLDCPQIFCPWSRALDASRLRDLRVRAGAGPR